MQDVKLVAAAWGNVDAVGGTNQNPDDPAYYNRWMGALANADEQYRILVGNQAFLLEQTQVNNQ